MKTKGSPGASAAYSSFIPSLTILHMLASFSSAPNRSRICAVLRFERRMFCAKYSGASHTVTRMSIPRCASFNAKQISSGFDVVTQIRSAPDW